MSVITITFLQAYIKHKSDKMIGFYDFLTPTLSVHDLFLVQSVLIKDFDHFVDRRTIVFNDPMMDEMLTNAKGTHWKGIRSLLTPTFTSGKMKSMYNLVLEKANLLAKVSEASRDEQFRINLVETTSKFTLDVIGSCAFGMEINSLLDENVKFSDNAKALFRRDKSRLIKVMFLIIFPNFCKWFGINFRPANFKYFMDIIEQTLERRMQGPRRGDFVDLMLDARKHPQEEDEGQREVDKSRIHKYSKCSTL